MGGANEASVVSSSGVRYGYDGAVRVLEVSPSVVMASGGSALSVAVSGVLDGRGAWCSMFGGRVVVAAEGAGSGGNVRCVSVGGVVGNTSVEVSVNGQEFSSGSGMLVELMEAANVTSVMPGVVPIGGGSVVIAGMGLSGYAKAGVYCGFGASTSSESWSVAMGTVSAGVGGGGGEHGRGKRGICGELIGCEVWVRGSG